MNQILCLISCLILIQSIVFSQQTESDWIKLSPLDPSERPYKDTFFFSPDTGYITGEMAIDGNFGRQIIGKTTDGGFSWDTTITFWGSFGNFIEFMNDSVGYTGAVNILRTSNRGNTWEKIKMLYGPEIVYMDFVDNKYGWAAAAAPPTLYRTVDGGLNWVKQREDEPSHYRYFLGVIDSTTIYIADRYNLFLSVDGGINWRTIDIPASLYTGDIRSIIFLSEDYGMVFMEYCSMIVTTDGGKTWLDRSPDNYNYVVNTADAVDSLSITIATGSGEVLRTDDGGLNWVSQILTPYYIRFMSVEMVNKDVTYIVGTSGYILKTTNGGVTFVSENGKSVPTKYRLSQNYPNPFNPSTNIDFDIPESGSVEITLYDIAGRKVKELMNENKRKGSYTLSVNLNGFASGVYVYSIVVKGLSENTKGFTASKKMLLMK